MTRWFDAHLDLAYLAEVGRDLHAPLAEARGRLLPAAVTLPELRAARVDACLATIFTEAQQPGQEADPALSPTAFPIGDTLAAWKAGLRQLKLYQAWRDAGVVRYLADPPPAAPTAEAPGVPAIGVLMECADPIETPDQLGEWVDGGVIAIGLTWAMPGRYAHGNSVPSSASTGLTDLGRELVKRMDELGVTHDASHLNEASLGHLFEATDRRVVASHSNVRKLVGDPDPTAAQRHLSDETIREIARRGGVIGVNLYSGFLHSGKARAQTADVVSHLETIRELTGSCAHIGLGSDMDGGFAADHLPAELDSPTRLGRLADALSSRGWADDEIAAFCWGNWARVFGLEDPAG